MSLSQNTFTATAGQTEFTITWTDPYYLSTSNVNATVNDTPWTVVAVSGTLVTLDAGINAGDTVKIFRVTDISDNQVNFLLNCL